MGSQCRGKGLVPNKAGRIAAQSRSTPENHPVNYPKMMCSKFQCRTPRRCRGKGSLVDELACPPQVHPSHRAVRTNRHKHLDRHRVLVVRAQHGCSFEDMLDSWSTRSSTSCPSCSCPWGSKEQPAWRAQTLLAHLRSSLRSTRGTSGRQSSYGLPRPRVVSVMSRCQRLR